MILTVCVGPWSCQNIPLLPRPWRKRDLSCQPVFWYIHRHLCCHLQMSSHQHPIPSSSHLSPVPFHTKHARPHPSFITELEKNLKSNWSIFLSSLFFCFLMLAWLVSQLPCVATVLSAAVLWTCRLLSPSAERCAYSRVYRC